MMCHLKRVFLFKKPCEVSLFFSCQLVFVEKEEIFEGIFSFLEDLFMFVFGHWFVVFSFSEWERRFSLMQGILACAAIPAFLSLSENVMSDLFFDISSVCR